MLAGLGGWAHTDQTAVLVSTADLALETLPVIKCQEHQEDVIGRDFCGHTPLNLELRAPGLL